MMYVGNFPERIRLWGTDSQQAYDAIMSCETDLGRKMYANERRELLMSSFDCSFTHAQELIVALGAEEAAIAKRADALFEGANARVEAAYRRYTRTGDA